MSKPYLEFLTNLGACSGTHLTLYVIMHIYKTFQKYQRNFWKKFLSGHLIKFFRAFIFPIFEFLLKSLHDAKGHSNPSTYPSWGSDKHQDQDGPSKDDLEQQARHPEQLHQTPQVEQQQE